MGVTKAHAYTEETGDKAGVTSTWTETSSPLLCLTLEEDGTTRCSRLATKDNPDEDRCSVHHGQYCMLYKKYDDASKVVDDMKHRAELPTKEQIGRYMDWKAALEEVRRVRTYVKAIRVERIGRDIHQRRFFLRVDGCHKRRLELLEREMARAVDVLDELHGRAYELYFLNDTVHAMNDPTTAEVDLEKRSKRTVEEVLQSICSPDALRNSILPNPRNRVLAPPATLGVGVEDLIDMALRDQRERMITILKSLTDFETFVDTFVACNFQPEVAASKVMLEKLFLIYQQFARRIIFHRPTLFMKSLETASFKDLILSSDFPIEDLGSFLDPFLRPLAYPLMWLKDAILDALVISRHNTTCNVGAVGGRFPLLGGWVFHGARTVSMSNEAWWFLLKILRPTADVENRFVRLCNNFEDLVGFFSFAAFGLVPSPRFCKSPTHFDVDDPGLSRKHLSLCGIIVMDIVAAPRPPHMHGPMPTTRKATQPDCIVWNEHETRAYMFGCMRNEPDAFVEAFLRELYARPDLFQVVLRSETAPDRDVEMFGSRSGVINNGALPAVRTRDFEAPPSSSPLSPAPSTRVKWDVVWSAVDVLYGKSEERQGYLVDAEQKPKDWIFRFKTFLVTYFVILDAVPHRHPWVLARNVSWAALRAQGVKDSEGKYTTAKYVVASDALLERCARERLGWMPKDMEWGITTMEDQRPSCIHGVM